MKRRTFRPRSFLPILFGSAALLFFLTWQHIQATRLGYRLSQIQHAVENQEQVNAYLKLELQELCSPERLEAIGKTRLGLVLPSYDSVILLEPQLTHYLPVPDAAKTKFLNPPLKS